MEKKNRKSLIKKIIAKIKRLLELLDGTKIFLNLNSQRVKVDKVVIVQNLKANKIKF